MKAKRKNSPQQSQIIRWLQRIVMSVVVIFLCGVISLLTYVAAWHLSEQFYYPYVEQALAEQCPDLNINVYEGGIGMDPIVSWRNGEQHCSGLSTKDLRCDCGK